ncbi:MAG: PEP-CTERM sorting domain-containing protein [Betaproteobacteria bacterium]|nr:PEP-CTERM sorting domain-containing protein [Betaproteobacteria bacterium]
MLCSCSSPHRASTAPRCRSRPPGPTASAVPEPESIALLLVGTLVVAWRVRPAGLSRPLKSFHYRREKSEETERLQTCRTCPRLAYSRERHAFGHHGPIGPHADRGCAQLWRHHTLIGRGLPASR